jgi:hypothetical protein
MGNTDANRLANAGPEQFASERRQASVPSLRPLSDEEI